MSQTGYKLKFLARLIFWSGTICCIANGIAWGPWYIWCTVGVAGSYVASLILSAYGDFLDYMDSTEQKLESMEKLLSQMGLTRHMADDLEKLVRLKESGGLTDTEYHVLKALLLNGTTEGGGSDGND